MSAQQRPRARLAPDTLHFIVKHPPVMSVDLSAARTFNQALFTQFTQLRDAPDTRRSHFFAGRYENIYINRDRAPLLDQLLQVATQSVQPILNVAPAELQVGYWFNEMHAGAITTKHNHDDNAELLSGTYYVTAPARSGELILHLPTPLHITPQAGRFIFFPSSLDHEVSIHRNEATRLSIGLNFFRQT